MGDLIVRVCKGLTATQYTYSVHIFICKCMFNATDAQFLGLYIGVLTGPHLKVDEKFHDFYLIGCEVFRSTILTYHMNSHKMVPSF